MAEKSKPLAWKRCRGRNGFDSALDVPEDMGTECLNVTFDEGGLGTKRYGGAAVTLTGATTTEPFVGMFRFVPGDDDTAAELIMVDRTGKIVRVAAGTAKAELTPKDTIDANIFDVCAVPLNGKLHLFYNSDVNRSMVFDPGLSTTTVRRSGLGKSAAPTAAEQGAGALSFTRYYKVAYTEQRSNVTFRKAELSASVSITIASKAGVTVTKPSAIDEGETHWELYASDTATGTYYLIATTAIATTTYSDTSATISTTTAEATAGTYTCFPSVKFAATDGSRLGGFGVWETSAGDSVAPKKGTFYFTPALDSTGTMDDERINNTVSTIGRIAVSRNSNAEDRGIAFFDNSWWCFQSRGITQFVPTENDTVPYRRIRRSSRLGLVRHQTLVEAEDEYGRPALYFLDPIKGPYRYGAAGFQWCGKDVYDLWRTRNLGATNVVAWGLAYPDLNAVIWWMATGSGSDPTLAIYFDYTEGRATLLGPDGAMTDVRYGWAKWTGDFAAAWSGCLFASTMGATMGREVVPYVSTSGALMKYSSSVTSDNSTVFQSYVQSKAFAPDPLYANKAILKSYLAADNADDVTITQALLRNFTDESARTSSVVLTNTAVGETAVLPKFEDASLQDAWCFQVRLGDPSAVANNWTLHQWWGAIETREDR